jgi:hypothetical protein
VGFDGLMAQSLTIAPAGLVSDPNPLSMAPDGAMTEALNVVIARPGVVEPRPGLQAQSSFTAIAVDEDIIRMIPFEGDILVLTKDVSDSTGHAYWYTANDDMVQAGTFIGASSAWTLTVGQAQAATLGGNLYITSGEGVFRCTAPGDDNAYRAGIPRPPPTETDLETVGGINYPFDPDSSWAYRVCESLTAGRLQVRSAPSSRVLARSYAGTAASYVEHTFARTPANVSEFYRSEVLADWDGTPSDEMTMVGTAAASAVEFNDDSEATGIRGAALYTNATQQGALLENGMPPICRDVATFREMAFFAGATRAPTMTFDVLAFGPDWRGGNQTYSDRLTDLTCSGGGVTVTMGSPTITGIAAADTAKLRVGMRVCDTAGIPDGNVADAQFPVSTYITVVGATSITLNNNALANGTDFIAMDWVEIAVTDAGGTQTERVFLSALRTSTRTTQSAEAIAVAGTEVGGPQLLAERLSALFTDPMVTVSAFGEGVVSPWTFLIEAFAYDVTSITVKISNDGATPERIDRTTGKTATQGGSVATLAWSKPGEPEHCPPGYFAEIGAADKAIERIIPTRDALLVFKEDGVWRVSGYSPDSLQVDEYDRTMRLVHPDAACEWDGQVAAWTNKGVMLLGGSGAQEISLPIANVIEAAGEVHAGNAAKGVFLAGWLDRGLLVLGIPSSTSTGFAEYVYCWSQRTGAWTRWTHDQRITTACAVGKDLYFGTRAADDLSEAVVLKAVAESYDLSTNITVSAVSETSITIDAGSGWTPAVGDVVRQTDVDYAVTAITSSTVFTVHTTGLTAAAAAALTRTPMTIEWTVRDGENAGAQKLFREATLLLGSASGLVANDNAYSTDRSQTASTTTASFTYTTSDAPTTVRTRIPRESRRCGRLEHALTLKGAKPGWALHGASYVFEPKSTRFRNAS